MYEATDLLLRRRPIQNDVTCIIWQPTVVGDPTYRPQPYTVEQFEPLQEYLLGFYPAEHEAAIVTTKTYPLTRSVVQRLQLRDLAVELEQAPQVGDPLHPAADRAAGRGHRVAGGDARGRVRTVRRRVIPAYRWTKHRNKRVIVGAVCRAGARLAATRQPRRPRRRCPSRRAGARGRPADHARPGGRRPAWRRAGRR